MSAHRPIVALILLAFLAACAPAAAPAKPAAAPPAEPAAAPAKPAAAAPAQSAPAAPPPAPAPVSLKLLQGHQGSAADAPAYLALERGYFKEEGLEVELERFNSLENQVGALSNGQLLVGVGGVNAGLFNAIARDIPLRIVADKIHYPPDYTGAGWLVRTDLLDSGRVREPKDLRDLTVGLGAIGSVQMSELDVLLKRGGLTMENLTTKNLPYADLAAAFANRSIDIAYTFEPFTSTVSDLGVARMWTPAGQVIPYHEGAIVIYSPVFAERHPEAAKAWMVAYVKGVRDFVRAFENMNPPDDVVAAMIKYGDEQDAAKIRRTRPGPVNPDGYPFKESLKTDLEYFVRAGIVKEPPDLDKAIDLSYADYAISRLGRFRPQ
jgi:NitT/TauT family transport system substrate-binding protein